MKFFFLRLVQNMADLAVLFIAFVLAFALRFEGDIPELFLKRMAFLVPYVVGTQFALLRLAGTHRFSWRYVGLRESVRIFQVLCVGAATFLVVRFAAAIAAESVPHAIYFIMPIGVTIMNLVLAFGGILGLRILRRVTAEQVERQARVPTERPAVRTLLVGAGQAGLLVAKELYTRPDLGIAPVGFVDDDPGKRSTIIHGVRVLGSTRELAELCTLHKAEQILITIASAPGGDIRRIHDACAETGLPLKIVPGLYELMNGTVNLSRIREVTIEDLLGRPQVELGDESLRRVVEGTRVLVTGAGGSIGSEICRQLLALRPSELILVEQAENALFGIHRELLGLREDSTTDIYPKIADVGDLTRLRNVFESHRPDLVFHAAAHKHVPMMEWNVGEAVKNNVFGTRNVARVAEELGTKKFVMISTDKAVNPSSVMGCTKRIAELVVQAMSKGGRTQFITVRFGNVLGSAGSVIPIFKEQIAKGGPVTVTHPEMTRYFMTIPEACQLVLHAGTMGNGGEIFILDMGKPVKIVDLASDLIRLSGMIPDEDIRIEFSGTRPGEKLFEELSSDLEAAQKTRHPKIFIGKAFDPSSNFASLLEEKLERLRSAADASDEASLRTLLRDVVPEFTGASPNLPA